MAPKKKSDDLPPNLYKNGDYYRYKHPITGKSFGMGSNREDAIADAKKANALLAQKTDFVRRILGEENDTWAGLVKRYITERQIDEGKKQSTTKEENYRLEHIVRDLGNIELGSTTQILGTIYSKQLISKRKTLFEANKNRQISKF